MTNESKTEPQNHFSNETKSGQPGVSDGAPSRKSDGPTIDSTRFDQSVPNQESNSKPLKKEINGPKGLEPTRYGDWEANGRCYDF